MKYVATLSFAMLLASTFFIGCKRSQSDKTKTNAFPSYDDQLKVVLFAPISTGNSILIVQKVEPLHFDVQLPQLYLPLSTGSFSAPIISGQLKDYIDNQTIHAKQESLLQSLKE